ncbi:MAG: Ig-like domain repeat protein [Acidimicrobiales bacterium]
MLALAVLAVFHPGFADAATAPTITLTPAPSTTVANGYADQATIEISAPANSFFPGGQAADIFECADPGGTTANLPKDNSACDVAGTNDPNNPFFAANGSLDEKNFTVYELPNGALGEGPNELACGTAQTPCVIFVGTDPNDFTVNHAFSPPFVFNGPPKTPFSTTVTVTSSANPVATGTPVTYTIKVAPTPDGGTVSLSDGTTAIANCASKTLDSTGAATCSETYSSPGSHQIVASYSGDKTFGSSDNSTSALTQAVSGGGTVSVALAATPSSPTANSPVTYTATVTPTSSSATTAPTGKVTFDDNGNPVSTACTAVTLTGGSGTPPPSTATCTFTYTAAGTHSITAVYSGDPNYAALTSAALPETIGSTTGGAVTVTVTASPDPPILGAAETYTATVLPTSNSSTSTPTGTVSFADGTTPIPSCGSVSVTPGAGTSATATCAVSSISSGSHSVIATYGGDPNYAKTSSSPLSQTVSADSGGSGSGSSGSGSSGSGSSCTSSSSSSTTTSSTTTSSTTTSSTMPCTSSSGGTTAGSSGSGGSGAGATTTADSSGGSGSSLAFTGFSLLVPFLIALGVLLLAAGFLGRRLLVA